MKFSDLAIGQRFELDGAVYVKTSPVLASGDHGNKFMARYQRVTPLDGEVARPRVDEARMVRADAALAAFNAFEQRFRETAPPDQLASLQPALDAGREAFLAALTRA